MLGFPILFSITLWSLWATNQRRRDLVRLFGPPKEISRTKGVGWFVCLLSIIILYAFLSVNVSYFYRTLPGWALLGEEGSHLAYVQSIMSGGVYGKDFSSPYGPMMIYPMVWLMKSLGPRYSLPDFTLIY